MANNPIFQHPWILLILVTFANAIILKFRVRRYIAEKPELKIGYDRLIRGFLIWGSLPWAVMGIGATYGGVTKIIDFFNYKSTNIYVQLWISTIVVEWILGFYWIFFRSGAEMLVAHPGIFNMPFQRPRDAKLLYVVSTIGGIFALYMATNVIK